MNYLHRGRAALNIGQWRRQTLLSHNKHVRHGPYKKAVDFCSNFAQYCTIEIIMHRCWACHSMTHNSFSFHQIHLTPPSSFSLIFAFLLSPSFTFLSHNLGKFMKARLSIQSIVWWQTVTSNAHENYAPRRACSNEPLELPRACFKRGLSSGQGKRKESLNNMARINPGRKRVSV